MSERINRDRAATNPGGMQCIRCDEIFIGEEWHDFCGVCFSEIQAKRKAEIDAAVSTQKDPS